MLIPKYDTFKICVSGAADGPDIEEAKGVATQVGEEIAKRKAALLTGATTGTPYFAAVGAKKADGFVIGFSPASTEKEHIKKYRLPLDHHDLIFYSNFGYAHRNSLLTTMADAVIIVCGRIGTLNEFTTTFEENKVIGVMLGSGGIADEIPHIIEVSKRGRGHIIYDHEPKSLVDKVVKQLVIEHK